MPASKDAFIVKMLRASDYVLYQLQSVEKCATLQRWRSLENFLDPDADTDNIQNVVIFSVSVDLFI